MLFSWGKKESKRWRRRRRRKKEAKLKSSRSNNISSYSNAFRRDAVDDENERKRKEVG
jgi:hypothetical protein